MTCGSCHRGFPPNHELATIPDARRVAFDPTRNRVWRVCHYCQHWNLLGPEASGSALPELELRFAARPASEYDGISLSGIGTSLELFRFGPESTLDNTAPARVATKDDAASKRRLKEIDQRTRLFVGFGWFMGGLLIFQTMTAVAILFDDHSVVEAAKVVVGSILGWVVYLGAVGWIWRRKHPDTPSLYLLWKQPKGKHRVVAFAMSAYVLHTIVEMFCRILDKGWTASTLSNLLMLAGLLVLTAIYSMVSEPVKHAKTLRRLYWLGGTLFVSFFVAITYSMTEKSSGWLVPALVSFPLLLGGGSALFGRRRVVVNATTADGQQIKLRASQAHALSFQWRAETEEFTVHGLPGGDTVTGNDATRVVSQVLRWYHHALPPAPGRTERAWELVHAVGDARGVLAALQGYQADNADRVSILTLPPTYRLALDLVLAEPTSETGAVTDPNLHGLRLAAASAAEVAEEAERLDAEL